MLEKRFYFDSCVEWVKRLSGFIAREKLPPPLFEGGKKRVDTEGTHRGTAPEWQLMFERIVLWKIIDIYFEKSLKATLSMTFMAF